VVQRVKLRHRAKFHGSQSNHCRDVIFRFFQDGGHPPPWIYDACVSTTHEGHLVVFIIVQNLVGIDAVVLIICKLRVRLQNSYSRPQNWDLGDLIP